MPREPGRGALSMMLNPFARMSSNALPDVADAECQVREAAAAAVPVDQFLDR